MGILDVCGKNGNGELCSGASDRHHVLLRVEGVFFFFFLLLFTDPSQVLQVADALCLQLTSQELQGKLTQIRIIEDK